MKTGKFVYVVILLLLLSLSAVADCDKPAGNVVSDGGRYESVKQTVEDGGKPILPFGEKDFGTGNESENESMNEMTMLIGDTPVQVEWEENESVEALMALAADEPLEIQMSMYGGFEQVGRIGRSLPRNDVQTVTNAGDIVLYSGDQIVVFYGSNSWAYTRLGHIADKSPQEMAQLLGNGNVTITIGR